MGIDSRLHHIHRAMLKSHGIKVYVIWYILNYGIPTNKP